MEAAGAFQLHPLIAGCQLHHACAATAFGSSPDTLSAPQHFAQVRLLRQSVNTRRAPKGQGTSWPAQGLTFLPASGAVADMTCDWEQVLVGQNAIMATPAMSALIRRRKLYGAPSLHCCIALLPPAKTVIGLPVLVPLLRPLLGPCVWRACPLWLCLLQPRQAGDMNHPTPSPHISL